MEKQKILLMAIIALILVLAFMYPFPKSNSICIGENCFDLELAETFAEHSQGLMFRENLPLNSGMLFIFEKEDDYSFWMKNTIITLDIIWINENKIVFIKRSAQPCINDPCESFSPNIPAKYVLEINGGLSEELGIIEGNEVKFYPD